MKTTLLPLKTIMTRVYLVRRSTGSVVWTGGLVASFAVFNWTEQTEGDYWIHVFYYHFHHSIDRALARDVVCVYVLFLFYVLFICLFNCECGTLCALTIYYLFYWCTVR